MTDPAIRNKLIVALDLATVDDARDMVKRLGDSVTHFKVGLELVTTVFAPADYFDEFCDFHRL